MFDGHRRDFIGEPARGHRGRRLRLRRGGEFILLLARDPPFLGHVLRRRTHMVALEGVPQTISDHGVDQGEIAHLLAGAQRRAMRRQAHILLTAGDDDLRVAAVDRLIAERHGSQAGTADLIDGDRRALDRDAGGDGRLARGVLPGAGGQHMPHDRIVDFTRLRLGAGERGFDRGAPKLHRRCGRKGAVERSDRRPRGAGDDDVLIGHAVSPLWRPRFFTAFGALSILRNRNGRPCAGPPQRSDCVRARKPIILGIYCSCEIQERPDGPRRRAGCGRRFVGPDRH